MIEFSLICDQGHSFNGWFRSSDQCAEQLADGKVICPDCDSRLVSKALQKTNVGARIGKGRGGASAVQTAPAPEKTATDTRPVAKPPATPLTPEAAETFQKLFTAAQKLREHVESSFENVGPKFAEEARKVHYGERENAAIYGEATREDVEDLLEEGVEIAPLPVLPKSDA